MAFEKPAEALKELTFTEIWHGDSGEEEPHVRIFKGYTVFVGVQRDAYDDVTTAIRVMLFRPAPEY